MSNKVGWFVLAVVGLVLWGMVQSVGGQTQPYQTYLLRAPAGAYYNDCLIITAQGYAVIWESPCPK